MLVGLGEARDGARVQAALVGEGARAGVGVVGRLRHVAELRHVLRHTRELREAVLSHAGGAHLQLQVGNDREQVGVAHPLPDAVHRALHARGAGAHGRERVGHRAARIVVAVDAERLARKRRRRGGHDGLHLEGQRATVGLAEVHRVSPRFHGGPHASQRVVGVGLVAVEVVLGIEHHAPPGRLQIGHRVGNHA